MNQIYDTSTKGKYQMLIGKTGKMYKTGKTPDEISLDIKQPVEKVLECIEYCKKADETRALMISGKSKICGGCIYNRDKDTCTCKHVCIRDYNGYYTGYTRAVKPEKTITDIFNSLSEDRKSIIYSLIYIMMRNYQMKSF